jgi:hypothetical protein
MNSLFGSGFLGSARLSQSSAGMPASSSLGRRWWAHHIASTRAYLEAALQADLHTSLVALGELWHAVQEWQRITQSPMAGLLMAEHTALAKLLVDCFAQSQASGCTDVAAAALERNVDIHRLLFPKNPAQFADLFGQHVDITGKYVTALASGDQAAFEADYARALDNGVLLGDFVDRNFVVRA